MKQEVPNKRTSARNSLNATRVITTTIGVLFGISGMNHGFFEVLQGNTSTNGVVITAIGEAQRFWPLGTEEAFTIIPNFLISGLLSMFLGLIIIIWSVRFIQTKHGPSVFLLLFILLFLFGGGIGQVAFFLPAWAFATRMNKPLNWWQKILPENIRPFLSNLWPVVLIISSIMMLIGLEIAIFGFVPGMSEPERIQNTAMYLIFSSALLNVVAYVAGFGHELCRHDNKSVLKEESHAENPV
jgi:hypothetical protein